MIVIWVLLLASCAASILLLGASWRVLGEPRSDLPGNFPPVSILKPLKGAEPDLSENLESFYRLEYPEYEIVFSFASRSDPAVEIARTVADGHAEIPTTFVFDGREPGANPKVSRLLHALTRARFPVILISDGDVRVSPSFLRDTAGELSDRRVGLVSNPFRAVGSGSFGSTVEALHFNGFVFGGTAAVSRVLRRPCVVGKSIFLRRDVLDWIGGFDAVKDFLAEDYRLGEIVTGAGFHVVMSPHVITVTSRGKSVAQFWARQVRWARMRRRLGGAGYAAEILASPIPWAFLFAGRPGMGWAAALVGAKIVGDLALLRSLDVRPRWSDMPAIVAKDFLFFGVFWASLVSNRTCWRGKSVAIGPRTLLTGS